MSGWFETMSVKARTPPGFITRQHSDEQPLLVGNVHPRLLPVDAIEPRVGQRHRRRIALDEIDEVLETDARVSRRAESMRLGVRSRPVTAQPMLVRDPACRPAEPAADVEHPVLAAEPAGARQPIGRLEAAVVILIELLQLVLGERVDVHALRRELGKDLVLVDRVRVVEVDHPGLQRRVDH